MTDHLGSFVDGAMYYNAPGYSVEDLEMAGFRTKSDSNLFLDFASDAAMAIPRGLEGLGRGLYNFADFATFDLLPDVNPRNQWTGHSKTIAGALMEGLVTFGVPGGYAFKAIGGMAKGTTLFGRLWRAQVAGGLADAVVADPHGGRLADLGKAIGWDNGFIDFLASDPDDGEIEARLKNVVEGGIIGGAFDGLFELVRGGVKMMRRIKAGESVEGAERAVLDELDQDVIRVATAERWIEEFGYDYDEALIVARTGELLGVDMDQVRFGHELLEDGYATPDAAGEMEFILDLDEGLLEGMDGNVRGLTVRSNLGREHGWANQVIIAMSRPDVTTGVHELGHVFRKQVYDAFFAEAGPARFERAGITREMLDDVAIEAGAKWDSEIEMWVWDTDAEENIAEMVESYFFQNLAPKKSTVRAFFERMAQFFREAYLALDVDGIRDVSPAMRKVLDKLFDPSRVELPRASIDPVTSLPSAFPRVAATALAQKIPDPYRSVTPANIGRRLGGFELRAEDGIGPTDGFKAGRRPPEGTDVDVWTYKGKNQVEARSRSDKFQDSGLMDGVVIRDATLYRTTTTSKGSFRAVADVRGKLSHEDPNTLLHGVRLTKVRSDYGGEHWVTEGGFTVSRAAEITIMGDEAFARGVVYLSPPGASGVLDPELARMFDGLASTGTSRNPEKWGMADEDRIGEMLSEYKDVTGSQKSVDALYDELKTGLVEAGTRGRTWPGAHRQEWLAQSLVGDKRFVGGLHDRLQEPAPAGLDVSKLPGKPFASTPKGKNRDAAVAKLWERADYVHKKIGPMDTIDKARSALAMMFGKEYVPRLFGRFLRDGVDDGVKDLDRLSQAQVDSAIRGLEFTQEFRRTVTESGANQNPELTAGVMVWGLLSRGAGPQAQESAFLHVMGRFGDQLDDLYASAARGEWGAREDGIWRGIEGNMKATLTSPDAASVLHNANAIGKMLRGLAQPVENGRSFLAELHHRLWLVEEGGMEYEQQLRRWFVKHAQFHGIGVASKVFSFAGLVAGRQNLVILDRIQTTRMAQDGSLVFVNRPRHKLLFDKRGNPRLDKHGEQRRQKTGVFSRTASDEEIEAGKAVKRHEEESTELVTDTYGGVERPFAGIMTGLAGAPIHELVENVMAPRVSGVFKRTKWSKRIPEQYHTLGGWHWLTWLADGLQEVDHSSLEAMARRWVDQMPNAQAVAGARVKRGKMNQWGYSDQMVFHEGGDFHWEVTPPGADKAVRMTSEEYGRYQENLQADHLGFLGTEYNGLLNPTNPPGFLVSDQVGRPWHRHEGVQEDAIEAHAKEAVSRSGGSGDARAVGALTAGLVRRAAGGAARILAGWTYEGTTAQLGEPPAAVSALAAQKPDWGSGKRRTVRVDSSKFRYGPGGKSAAYSRYAELIEEDVPMLQAEYGIELRDGDRALLSPDGQGGVVLRAEGVADFIPITKNLTEVEDTRKLLSAFALARSEGYTTVRFDSSDPAFSQQKWLAEEAGFTVTEGGTAAGKGVNLTIWPENPKRTGQTFESAGTSRSTKTKLPGVFSQVEWVKGTRNADIGGGKYDDATQFLDGLGVENVVYDPFNRSPEWNSGAAAKIAGGQADTATIANVLNVIDSPEARRLVIEQAFDAVKPGGRAYFFGKYKAKPGPSGGDKFQTGRSVVDDLEEIRAVFPDATVKNGMVVAPKPRPSVLAQARRRAATRPKGDYDPRFGGRRRSDLPYEPVNLDRVNTVHGLNATWASIRRQAEDLLNDEEFMPIGQPERLSETYERGVQALSELGEAMGDAPMTPDMVGRLVRAQAEILRESAANAVAFRAHLAMLQENAMVYIRDILTQGDDALTDEVLAEAARRLSILETAAVDIRRMQSETGRLLSGQRIRIDTTDFDARKIVIPPAEQLDPGSAAEIVAKHGGRKKMIKKLRQAEAAAAANPGQPGRISKHRGPFSMITEYFINNILSGPVTHAVNLTGGVMTNIVEPLERAAGAVLTGQPGVARREVVELASMFGDARETMRIAWLAMRDDSEKIAKGTGHLNEQAGRTIRAWSAAGQGVPEESMYGHALNRLGAVVNLPGRLMMGVDQAIKATGFRARLRRRLTEIAIDRYPDDPQSRAMFIERHLDVQTAEGQALSRRALQTRASREASAMGLQGEARDEYVAKWVTENWDEDVHHAALEALEVARVRTFTNELQNKRGEMGISSLLTGGRFSTRDFFGQLSGFVAAMTNQLPAMKFILPFVRTPANILMWANNRTFGAASDVLGATVRRIARKEIDNLTPAAMQDAIGRAAIGTSAILTGWAYATTQTEEGIPLLTGGGPVDPAMREAWEASGWKPYSIRMGDRWVQYNRLDPVASVFSLIADIAAEPQLAAYMARDEEMGKAMYVSVLHSLTDKTYLKGLADFIRLLDNPEQDGSRYMNNMVGAFMPASSFVNQAYLPVVEGEKVLREVRTAVDAVRARFILGDRDKLAVRRNALGEPIVRDSGFMGQRDPLSPIRSTGVRKDQVSVELVRSGVGLGAPGTKRKGVDWLDFTDPDGVSAYDRLQENVGKVKVGGRSIRQTLQALVTSGGYQRLSYQGADEMDSPRAQAIKKVLSVYRRAAEQQTLRDFPDLQQAIAEVAYRQAGLRAGAM